MIATDQVVEHVDSGRFTLIDLVWKSPETFSFKIGNHEDKTFWWIQDDFENIRSTVYLVVISSTEKVLKTFRKPFEEPQM